MPPYFEYTFLGTIVPRKYMPIIFAVGLSCCDKFEETPNEKVVDMSKLVKSYFSRNISYSVKMFHSTFSIIYYWSPITRDKRFQEIEAPYSFLKAVLIQCLLAPQVLRCFSALKQKHYCCDQKQGHHSQ